MDMPTVDTAAEAYIPKSAYTNARVGADPKTAGREVGLATVHTNLVALLRHRDDLRELEQKNSALLDAADEAVDDDVEGFELHLLGAVKKNRDNPKYRRYFPDGLRAVTTADARKEEPEIVAAMLETMAEDENDSDIGEAVRTWKPKLSASHARVIAADETLTTTEKALTTVEDVKLPALLANWRDEYKKLEGALMMVYSTDSKRVARFFKAFRKNRKVSKPQTPTPTP